jgi:hypothetical protein
MSPNGAYEEEMERETAMFMEALRAAVPAQPDPRFGESLVPRLAQAARAATVEAETRSARAITRPPRSRRTLVARVAIAVALLPLLLAGMAFAGVTLPQPARSVFSAVGIHLPNQPSERSSSSAGTSGAGAAASEPASTSGKAKGQANAEQKKHHGKGKGHAKQHGKSSTAPHGVAHGHTGSPGTRGNGGSNSSAGGNGASHGGGSSGSSGSAHSKAPSAPRGQAKGHSK